MKLEIKAIKALKSQSIVSETARYEVSYGIHRYETLELFCKEHRLNSRLVSRRINAYKKENGSLEGITFDDISSKHDRTITIDGRSYTNIQEHLDTQGLSGEENRKIFNKYKRKIKKKGSYDNPKNPQLIKIAVDLTKKEVNTKNVAKN